MITLYVVPLQLTTGRAKVAKGSVKRKGALRVTVETATKRLSGLAVAVVLAVLAGCASVQNLVNLGGDDAPRYPNDPSQVDHWLDQATAWRYWDVAAPSNQDVEWSFQENALSVALKARTDLNIFDGAPHTLSLKVIQLSDASAFKTLAQSVGGVRAMLTQSQEMIAGAVFSSDVLVAPGQVMTLKLPRQQDARFLGLVAGYSELAPGRSVRLLTIPVVPRAGGESKSLLSSASLGLLGGDPAPSSVARPARLEIKIDFGAQGIDGFAAKAF